MNWLRPIAMTTEPSGLLLDVNVLVALVWDQHLHHDAARRRFGVDDSPFATSPVTESGFVRLLLTPAVVGRTVSAAEALSVLAGIRAQPRWVWIDDDASFDDPVIDLRVLAGRRQVTDLHLVNLAARHGFRLATFDAGLAPSLAPADRHLIDLWMP